jgi:hypothetical protein
MSDGDTTEYTLTETEVLEELMVVYGEIVSAEVREDDETGDTEVVIEVAEAIGECPACGSKTVGSAAWNSAHDCRFGCHNDDCPVDRHSNAVFAPEGGTRAA